MMEEKHPPGHGPWDHVITQGFTLHDVPLGVPWVLREQLHARSCEVRGNGCLDMRSGCEHRSHEMLAQARQTAARSTPCASSEQAAPIRGRTREAASGQGLHAGTQFWRTRVHFLPLRSCGPLCRHGHRLPVQLQHHHVYLPIPSLQ